MPTAVPIVPPLAAMADGSLRAANARARHVAEQHRSQVDLHAFRLPRSRGPNCDKFGRGTPEINPSMRHHGLAISRSLRPPLLTLERSLWLTRHPADLMLEGGRERG